MGEFIDKADGERILEILSTGITADGKKPPVHLDENPLYRFERNERGNSYRYDTAIENLFVLLKRNGYGDTHVAKSDETFRTAASRNLAGGDPHWVRATDRHDLDKVMYLINDRQRKNTCGPHFLAERICDGTFHAILTRAMEHGSNVKPAYRPQSCARVSTPQP